MKTGISVNALVLAAWACLGPIDGRSQIGQELWSFQAGEVVFASPTIDSSGNVYIGSIDGQTGGTMYSIDENGNERWSTQTGDWIESTAALSPDESTVYVGSWDNRLYALDAQTGATDWTFETASLIFSSPAVAGDGTIYLGGADGFVYAIDANGSALWEVFLGGEIDSSIAIGPDGSLYLATTEGFVFALDRSDGGELWSYEIPVEPGASGRETTITGSCALDGRGLVFLGCANHFFYAFDSEDGTVAWNYETGGPIEASPTIGIDGSVLISSQDGYLYALDSSGNLQWRTEIGANFYASAAVDEIGRIYVGSFLNASLSYLNALSPDGAILQRIAFPDIVDSSVALSSDGKLYVGSNQGELHAFANGAWLSNSVWPKFRGNLASRGSILNYEPPEFDKERLFNISLRAAPLGGESDIIAGFTVVGTTEKNLLVRAVGPGLAGEGVPDVLEDPIAYFFDSEGLSGSNDDWGDSPSAPILPSEMARVGAFALTEGSADSADILTLETGVHTVIVSNANPESDTGIALVEVYNADEDDSEAALSNVSMRGFVGTGAEVLIPGFVIQGNLPKRILIRAIGEGLSDKGVVNYLDDPVISLYNDGPSLIASNDDWDAQPEKDQLAAYMEASGAFELEEGSGDSAMFVWLEPGLYTAIVSGNNGSTGVALVELYDLTSLP